MVHPISNFTVFLALLGSLICISEIQSSPCLMRFKNFVELQKSQLSCMRSLGIQENGLIQSSDQLAKDNYQDKCLANCVLGKMNLLNTNKTANTVALTETIKRNAPSEFQSKLLEIVNKCSNSAVKKSKELDAIETTKNVCKYAALFLYCFMEEDASSNLC